MQKAKRAGGVAQAGEWLRNKHKVLSANSSITKKKKRKKKNMERKGQRG
jgi:hypothetical protein